MPHNIVWRLHTSMRKSRKNGSLAFALLRATVCGPAFQWQIAGTFSLVRGCVATGCRAITTLVNQHGDTYNACVANLHPDCEFYVVPCRLDVREERFAAIRVANRLRD